MLEVVIAVLTYGIGTAIKQSARFAKFISWFPSLNKIKKLPDGEMDRYDDIKKADGKKEVEEDRKKVMDHSEESQEGKNWLEYHESETDIEGKQKFGHTIDRHIGKSDEEIIRRMQDQLANNGRTRIVSASSSFLDDKTAERIISQSINDNRDFINSWLRKEGDTSNFVMDYSGDVVIGKGITKANFLDAIDNNYSPSTEGFKNARIVLKKNLNGDGYFILTSYPTP